jgi:hypothetical protein
MQAHGATSLPDAPGLAQSSSTSAASAPAAASAPSGDQSKRMFSFIPNYSSVSEGMHLPPQSAKEKFVTATQDNFSISSFAIAAVGAAEQYGTNATPEFGKGGVGYGRYLWHSVVDRSSENYFVEFIVPTIAREDIRYYRLGPGNGTMQRIGHALRHAVVTRNQDGRATFNFGEVVGAGAAAGVSNFYYPSPERTFSNTAERWGDNIGVDAAGFVIREFWPEIDHKLFHGSQPMASH